MINISAIAADHNIPADELTKYVVGRGWDLVAIGKMTDVEGGADYLNATFASYASKLAAHQAKKDAAHKAFIAKWETPSKAAQARPDRACKRCGGVGRIVTFSHVNDGHCFRCEGTGVK